MRVRHHGAAAVPDHDPQDPVRPADRALKVDTWAGGTHGGVSVTMSTTKVAWNAPSTTFASNHGSDLKIVFTGSVVLLPGSGTGPGIPSKPYVEITLSGTGFDYDPAKGSLAVDIPSDGTKYTGGSTWASADVQNHEWTHVAIVVDDAKGTASWCIDGQLQPRGLRFPIGRSNHSNTDFHVGKHTSASTSTAHFEMDDFRMYGRPLDQAEILGAMASENAAASTFGTDCGRGGAGVIGTASPMRHSVFVPGDSVFVPRDCHLGSTRANLSPMLRRYACFLIALAAPAERAPAQCSAPGGYYAAIDTSSAAALRRTLHARIENHRRVSWGSTWAVLERADQDPNNSGRILDVYRNASYAKVGRGNSNYDREHTWPKSLGFARSSGSNYPEADCHGLFLSAIVYNGARGNKILRNLSAAATEWTTNGGGSGSYPGKSNWATGVGVAGGWETWVGRRGDIARALLYFDVRYDGSRHQGGATEPNLVLTDDVQRIVASQSSNNLSLAYMGLLSVLLDWHRQDPPDARECRRNDAVYQAQGNRNPFIDHPEWVARLQGAKLRDTRRAWINEFHYDNTGQDLGEMVEIAGPVGLNLAGWRLIAYNGNGGRAYSTKALGGSIGAASGCTGTLVFPFPNLQNGPNDAIALVDPDDRVVEFLSYEGAMTAVDGLARGLRSTDVGVAESSATPVGHSLQRSGTGTIGRDFTWSGPRANTGGRVNSQQSFVSGCGQAFLFGCGANPIGSMFLAGGIPSIGTTFSIGIHNPLGTQSPGAAVLLAVSLAPPPGFPCGIALPGFSMRAAGSAGELLVNPNMLVLPAANWNGSPTLVALPLPKDSKLIGSRVYLQGACLSPGASNGITIGLTEGMQVQIGS